MDSTREVTLGVCEVFKKKINKKYY
jgi:hypothetical protein